MFSISEKSEEKVEMNNEIEIEREETKEIEKIENLNEKNKLNNLNNSFHQISNLLKNLEEKNLMVMEGKRALYSTRLN